MTIKKTKISISKGLDRNYYYPKSLGLGRLLDLELMRLHINYKVDSNNLCLYLYRFFCEAGIADNSKLQEFINIEAGKIAQEVFSSRYMNDLDNSFNTFCIQLRLFLKRNLDTLTLLYGD